MPPMSELPGLTDDEVRYLRYLVGRDLHHVRRGHEELRRKLGAAYDSSRKANKITFINNVLHKLGTEP